MTIKTMMMLAKLKDAADKLQTMDLKGADLVSLAHEFGVDVDPETANFIAEQVPAFASGDDETVTDFVTKGGLMRMIGSRISPKLQSNAGLAPARCPHCDNLVFIQ